MDSRWLCVGSHVGDCISLGACIAHLSLGHRLLAFQSGYFARCVLQYLFVLNFEHFSENRRPESRPCDEYIQQLHNANCHDNLLHLRSLEAAPEEREYAKEMPKESILLCCSRLGAEYERVEDGAYGYHSVVCPLSQHRCKSAEKAHSKFDSLQRFAPSPTCSCRVLPGRQPLVTYLTL